MSEKGLFVNEDILEFFSFHRFQLYFLDVCTYIENSQIVKLAITLEKL